VPMCAGEDAIFGQNMAKKFKRAEDWTINVPHRVPETWKGFWGTRGEKGRGVPQRRVWIEGWSRGQVLAESLKWLVKTIVWLLLIFPWVIKCMRLASVLPKSKSSWTKLIIPVLADRIFHEFGRWQGVVMVFQQSLPSELKSQSNCSQPSF
jgi:hypothetical protein